MLIQFPKRRVHVRASAAASLGAGLRKASSGTSFPERSLSRLASPRDASLRPAKILRRCHSEHSAAEAIFGIVIPFRSAQASIGCWSDMAPTISTRNSSSQAEIFPSEIRNKINGLVNCGMAKPQTKTKPFKAPPSKPPERDLEPLYVGEWIEVAGKKQHEVVKATRISQPHISNMSNGRRPNPSAARLRKIAQFLGIGTDDLYQPPPPKEQSDRYRTLSAGAKSLLIDGPKDKDK